MHGPLELALSHFSARVHFPVLFSRWNFGEGVRIRTDGKKKVVWDWIRITVSQRTQKQQLEGGGGGVTIRIPISHPIDPPTRGRAGD